MAHDDEAERISDAEFFEAMSNEVSATRAEIGCLMEVNDRFFEGLRQIVQWADAYPLSVFPEPDLKRAHEVLKAHGMTLDAISASAMRHCLKGVRKIAVEAMGLEDDQTKGEDHAKDNPDSEARG